MASKVSQALMKKGRESLVIFHLSSSALNASKGIGTLKTTDHSAAQFQQLAGFRGRMKCEEIQPKRQLDRARVCWPGQRQVGQGQLTFRHSPRSPLPSVTWAWAQVTKEISLFQRAQNALYRGGT